MAVLVDREVGGEVRRLAGVEARRLEVEVLDQQQAGRADRLDRERAAHRDDQALLVAEARGDGGGDQEGDQAGVRQQRRQLRVLVPVAVHEVPAVGGRRLAHVQAVPAQHGPDVLGA